MRYFQIYQYIETTIGAAASLVKGFRVSRSTSCIPSDRIQQELGLSRSAAYRRLRAASATVSFRIENGIVIRIPS
jgi:hypothetical protein